MGKEEFSGEDAQHAMFRMKYCDQSFSRLHSRIDSFWWWLLGGVAGVIVVAVLATYTLQGRLTSLETGQKAITDMLSSVLGRAKADTAPLPANPPSPGCQ